MFMDRHLFRAFDTCADDHPPSATTIVRYTFSIRPLVKRYEDVIADSEASLHSLLNAVYTGDMKPNDLTESQRIIGLIEAGTASRSDVDFLLIHLREDLREGDPIKDIAHCIAHSKRDRGYAFKYVEDFVNKVIEWIQSGGRLVVKV